MSSPSPDNSQLVAAMATADRMGLHNVITPSNVLAWIEARYPETEWTLELLAPHFTTDCQELPC